MTNNDDLALKSRIEKALTDFTNGRACMHVPAQETDVDLVLADCLTLLAERDADKKLIGELDAGLIEYSRIAAKNAERVAELEARTVSVKLPDRDDFWDEGVFLGVEYADAVNAALTDAGINLEVEE